MKYKTIGAFKGVQNVPYCKADADMAVGMGVILDRVAKTAKLPASAEDAKGCFRIVSNINDRPEAHSFEDSVAVLKDEYVRADDLTSVANLESIPIWPWLISSCLVSAASWKRLLLLMATRSILRSLA